MVGGYSSVLLPILFPVTRHVDTWNFNQTITIVSCIASNSIDLTPYRPHTIPSDYINRMDTPPPRIAMPFREALGQILCIICITVMSALFGVKIAGDRLQHLNYARILVLLLYLISWAFTNMSFVLLSTNTGTFCMGHGHANCGRVKFLTHLTFAHTKGISFRATCLF
ncbi:hypothetical protein BC936DRAFT_143708 [Jimgerdemannia flammicorona]|uniref:Uncharacterized protein n=1 Tax=Jimgerdemannia flammicorona TaxID=994334 RepID=A0A433DDK3_9FUNG|nr:hypothetical protein BC936DRAFT_143708 [Jimgerdemannia flammicorona]